MTNVQAVDNDEHHLPPTVEETPHAATPPPPHEPATEDWLVEADRLATRLREVRAANAETRFAIGDWLNTYADRENVYGIGEEKFQMPRKQLVDYASTARRIPFLMRTFSVSFNHYRVVANAAEQDKASDWLAYAERFHPTCDDLRKSILVASPVTKRISVLVSAGTYASLQSFADSHGSTLLEVASSWLQEKVDAEVAQANEQPVPASASSRLRLRKQAEHEEQRRLAEKDYFAKFPDPTPEEARRRAWEFTERWNAFLQSRHFRKPASPTVHTVAMRSGPYTERGHQPTSDTPTSDTSTATLSKPEDEQKEAWEDAYLDAVAEGKTPDEAREIADQTKIKNAVNDCQTKVADSAVGDA